MAKKRNQVIQSAKKQMVESFKLPKDFVMGMPLTAITGCEEAFIENYKGIIECNNRSVLVQTKSCRIHFIGVNLCVEYYTDEEMKITGKIKQISFFE